MLPMKKHKLVHVYLSGQTVSAELNIKQYAEDMFSV